MCQPNRPPVGNSESSTDVADQEVRASVARLSRDLAIAQSNIEALQARLSGLFPPELGPTLENVPPPLLPMARERSGVPNNTWVPALPSDVRYAMFESVFYESQLVSVKQRVYLPYIRSGQPDDSTPFLDLGCGRGEFLHILRDAGIHAVGVDQSSSAITALRADGFNVCAQDLLMFLETDQRTFWGASLLQVVEHLDDVKMQRVLAVLAQKLVPGAVLIVETPNPLSPFALAHFHTDPTHVAPIPPDRMRYEIEAAGFSTPRLLFQARIPYDQFAGPDPTAYYADYAVIAYR